MELTAAPRSALDRVTADIGEIALKRATGVRWLAGLFLSMALCLLLFLSLTVLFWKGVGIWGINIPVAWGFAIINFVWWIGIGHAGTFISAILLLCRQEWRNSINRLAETMTIFAIMCAGMFPAIHLGRPQRIYWLIPYHNSMSLWPQFRSALIWDEFAVFTYFTVSLIFWYLGLIPDLATLRDRATSRVAQVAYGIGALGWKGSARDWYRYSTVYVILAGLATPLVVSVHSIVSLDFAAAQLPGWHSTIFPPYFVAGAIFSGFAMVLSVALPARRYFNLERYITDDHLDKMAKVLLAMGLFVSYGYLMEGFISWYSGNEYESFVTMNRLIGPYAPVTWLLLFCNVLAPQVLWIPSVRKNALQLFLISIVVNIGMWLERFMIVITSLHRDFLPSSWGMYYPTRWDIFTLLGSLGVFLLGILLFVRYLPMISMHEIREEHDEPR